MLGRYLPILFMLGLWSGSCRGQGSGLGPDGLVIRKDSTWKLGFRFRMQDRAVFTHTEGDNEEDVLQMQVRRLRLRTDGYVLSSRLEYRFQLGFSERDMDRGDGKSPPNPVMDAWMQYQLWPGTRIAFGQGRLPGGRMALISSGEMELPERPLANASFGIDRDIGLFVVQRIAMGRQVLRAHAAITQGEGRGGPTAGMGLCWTGRLEWLPFGEFSGRGEYVEGDLALEERPKLMLATAYSLDQEAGRARAQAGPYFPGGEVRDVGSFYADAVLKGGGWSWQNEYARRMAGGSPTVDGLAVAAPAVSVNEGWGFTSQLGRMLGKRSELAARWSCVRPAESVQAVYPTRDEAMLGYTRFVNGHRVKLQAAVFYNWGDGEMDAATPGNAYGAMFQVELGI